MSDGTFHDSSVNEIFKTFEAEAESDECAIATCRAEIKIPSSKGAERECWEFHNVTLTRVSGYGFGIAVSGGRDNPIFTNGDPSIAISDVLKAGPAEGKLRLNDRVISANGISLENVDYATAVQVLRECGNTVNLVIKRRVVLPLNNNGPQTLKVTLTKNKKKEDFGIVLGCWIYIKEITNKSILAKDESVREGDIITKINSNSVEGLSLKEAKKLIDSTKEKLHLVVRRDHAKPTENQENWSTRVPSDAVIQNKDMPPSSSFTDISASRPLWSNQNVYVQSPTRDFKSATTKLGDKNNLARPQGNWNHDMTDNMYNPNDNMNHMQMNSNSTRIEDMYVPPRPPLPQVDGRVENYDHDFRRNSSPPDPRFISFQKDGTWGPADRWQKFGFLGTGFSMYAPSARVNDIDMRGFTKEEAVALLVSIQDQINLIVQYRKDEYEDVINSSKGDSFYIRTHFSHESSGKGELSFRKGEVFHVVDTLYNGKPGSWLVYRLGRNGQEIQRGVIPNSSRAKELAKSTKIFSKKRDRVFQECALPDEAITDDFLFAMSSRLSYASSPESDLDISMDNRSSSFREADFQNDRRLVKSSSDPSITAAEELADGKKFSNYPTYSLGRNAQLLYPYYIFRRETAIPIQSVLKNANDMMTVPARVMPVEQEEYSMHSPQTNTCSTFAPHQRSRIDPYATLTPSERIANQISGELKEMYEVGPRSLKPRPPQIDRSNKPIHNYDQGQNVPDVNMNVPHDYINTMESFDTMLANQDRTVFNEESPYPEEPSIMSNSYQYKSAASLTKFSQMKNRHESKPPPPPPPIKSSKTRLSDGRPIPPPKPVQLQNKHWQPVPEQPAVRDHPESAFKANYSEENGHSSTLPYHSRSYPTSPSKPPPPPKRKDPAYYKQYKENHRDINSSTIERSSMGHSYSQDNVYQYSGNRAYSNVMFRNGQSSGACSPPPPPPMGLDLTTREHRGSAFELYRKTDGLHQESHQVSQRKYTLEESDANHSVIASASGVFGPEGGTLASKETGVTVIIPPGAISEGEKHEIYFKVCQDSNMLPPLDKEKGETLLSPLVMCGPHGLKFNVPIELRLPHCASISPDNWSFALKSSDTPNGEPAEWQNLENRDGMTSSRVENDYVSVLVDHF
ncbi:Tight junction protein ZO-1 like protein [Argiope bruennichi]|uniref:Tight junction protein ZO-1 like protein n=1 Tax=Argiope bruennichi TaxID=94029 RepID=A0A8T0FDZ1_ARGBR|nr:Tight junction protein ZO-1 like protein [Argiope bruennichi]